MKGMSVIVKTIASWIKMLIFLYYPFVYEERHCKDSEIFLLSPDDVLAVQPEEFIRVENRSRGADMLEGEMIY